MQIYKTVLPPSLKKFSSHKTGETLYTLKYFLDTESKATVVHIFTGLKPKYDLVLVSIYNIIY